MGTLDSGRRDGVKHRVGERRRCLRELSLSLSLSLSPSLSLTLSLSLSLSLSSSLLFNFLFRAGSSRRAESLAENFAGVDQWHHHDDSAFLELRKVQVEGL
jgi:hypothetical protein